MDPNRQVTVQAARGAQRGLYADVRATFRAPIVNWIFRALAANHPDFLRYAWGQAKPVFDTRGFAEFAVEYRDAILSQVADASDPTIAPYRPADLGLPPAEYRELRGQLATFDAVAPRLAVLFELLDRGLHDRAVGVEPADVESATAPFPDHLVRDDLLAPTLIDTSAAPASLDGLIVAVRERHGLAGGLPSVHRCLAQWPPFFERAWADLEPLLRTAAYRDGVAEANAGVEAFVDGSPYRPRIAPTDLRGIGLAADEIADLTEGVEAFLAGPADSVIPTLPLYAVLADAAGPRRV